MEVTSQEATILKLTGAKSSLRKYAQLGQQVYISFCLSFHMLPLAARTARKISKEKRKASLDFSFEEILFSCLYSQAR